MRQVYQFGGSGTLVAKKHFAHKTCVPQGMKDYRNRALDFSRYLVIVPEADLQAHPCFICNEPMVVVNHA